METFRDRIIDFREVKASDLAPHPLNDKIHPTEQQVALRAAARRRGITAVVYAVEREGKLLLVDGHLRRDLIQSGTVRVAVLDLTDAEVLEELVAHDQIASLAEINPTLRLANVESIAPEAVESLGLTEEKVEELRAETAEPTIPDDFKEYDPDAMEFEHSCPKCGFAWSDPK